MDIYKIVKDYQKTINTNFENDERLEAVESVEKQLHTIEKELAQSKQEKPKSKAASQKEKSFYSRKPHSRPVLSFENIKPDLDNSFTINQLKEKYQVNYTSLRVFFKNHNIRFDHFLQRYTYKSELEILKNLFKELQALGISIEEFASQKSITPKSFYSKLLSFSLIKEEEYNQKFPLTINSLETVQKKQAITESLKKADMEKNDLIENKMNGQISAEHTSAVANFNNEEIILLKEFAQLIKPSSEPDKQNENFIPVMIKHSLYMKLISTAVKKNMPMDILLENAINAFAEKENTD